MKTLQSIAGKTYVITSPNGCTVTDETGLTLGTVDAGQQKVFIATGAKLQADDDSARITATFNLAPALGSDSGGGASINFDEVPTEGSGNAVTSGGLYSKLMSPICIGKGATAPRPSAIVIGQDAKSSNSTDHIILIGNNIQTSINSAELITIGRSSTASAYSVSLGANAKTYIHGIAIGKSSVATAKFSTAIGVGSKAADKGVVAISAWNDSSGFDNATIQTQLYLIGAGSTLANTYEGGEACLGYVTKQTNGTVLACGTRKLSELLTNNTAFAPAAMDLDADPPTPFLPTGALEPIELPEPEVYHENNI